MISENSRYFELPLREHVEPDGTRTPYLSRRFLPNPEHVVMAGQHLVTPTDRVDLMSHAAYADPTQFWRLADVAKIFDPLELEIPGQRIDIPFAGPAFLRIAPEGDDL